MKAEKARAKVKAKAKAKANARVKVKSRKHELIYPVALRITMEPIGKQSRNYNFSYWEGFYPSPKHEKAAVETIAAVQSVLGAKFGKRLRVERRDRGIFIGALVEGALSRGEIGDLLVSEFMPWSDAASTPLRKVFEAAMVQTMMSSRQEMVMNELSAKAKAKISRLKAGLSEEMKVRFSRAEAEFERERNKPFEVFGSPHGVPDEDGAFGDVEDD